MWGLKHFYSRPTSPWVPMLLLIQKYIKHSVRLEAPNSVSALKRKHKNHINHYDKQRRVHMANSACARVNENQYLNHGGPNQRHIRQAPTHWLKFYEEAVIESEARTAVVQLKSKAYPSRMIGLIRHAVCRIISRLKPILL